MKYRIYIDMNMLRWTYAVLLLLMVQSCLSGSYEGSSDDMYGDTELLQPVQVFIGDPTGEIVKKGTALKGTGPIDNMSQVLGKDIFVYAFNSDMFTSYDKTSEKDNINTLVDGSVDNSGTKAGKRARTRAGSVSLDWIDNKIDLNYHAGSMTQIPYEFYAYYLDDLQVDESDYTRTDDAVKIKVEIDGRRDLMSAKAEITEAQLELAGDNRDYAREYSFSYYTSILGIHPTFYFKHHLARLEFELVPGYVQTGSKDVTVVSVKVYSKYKADFVVAEKSHPSQLGLRFEDAYKPFTLTEKDGSAIAEDRYVVRTLSDSGETPTATKMGDCLLVAPQNEALIALVRLRETRADGVVLDSETEMKLTYAGQTNPMMFAAGNKYKVKLQVYGATNVTSVVTLEKWNEGGKVEVDTENDKPEI